MPHMVHVAGVNGGIEIPFEVVDPYLPRDSADEYNELLADAAVEQLKGTKYTAKPEQVPWYPEEHVPLSEWDERSEDDIGGDE